MNMVWHDYIASNDPAGRIKRIPPAIGQNPGDRVIRKERPAITHTSGYEKERWVIPLKYHAKPA